jgi:PilS N terminal
MMSGSSLPPASPRRLRRGALGTMDTLLSITAGALFLIGSITIFNKAMSKTSERALANEATLIVQSVRGLYQNQASYGATTPWTASATSAGTVSGFDVTSVLVASRQMLNEMNNGTGLRNAFGGTWSVTGLLDAFALTATNIPRENCSAILAALNTSDLRHMAVVSAGAGNDACAENTSSACPATPANIVAACANGAANGLATIRLVYR